MSRVYRSMFYNKKYPDRGFYRGVFIFHVNDSLCNCMISDQSIIIKIASPSSITPVSRKPAL